MAITNFIVSLTPSFEQCTLDSFTTGTAAQAYVHGGDNIFSIIQSGDTEWHSYSGRNGFSLSIRTRTNYTDIYVFYNDTQICGASTLSRTQCTQMKVAIGVDESTLYGYVYIVYLRNNQSRFDIIDGSVNANRSTLYEAITGAIPVTYTWKSVPALSGNDAQYFCNLAQIADDKIGSIESVVVTQDRSYFTALPSQADLFYIISNLTNNTWHTIGYCGANEIQAYKSYIAAQNPDNDAYSVQLRLMMAAGNTYPLTTPQNISVYLNRKYTAYIGFVEDAENEVAMLDYIIEYDGATWQYNNLTGYSESVMQGIYTWLHPDGEDNPDESDDPYDAGSTDLGGEGGLPTPQDSLHLSTAPTKGGLELGFITAYVPTPTQLAEIADFLWSDDVLDNFKKYFNNFADNIISLYMLPYEPSSMPTKKFKVGKMESEDIGNVSYITQRVVDIDMGEFIISPKWTSYLDYAPYTKFDVFLPFLGIHSLDTDEIMSPANMEGYLSDKQGCTISLTYRLDLLTGNIVAYLKINGEIRYQFSGKCGWQIPITGQSFSSMIQSIITAGAGLASTIAAGGLTAPLKGLAKGAGVEAAISGTVAAQKPNVYRAGSLSGDISMLGYDTPYLIRTMPSKAECKNLKSFIGYPSYKTGKLSEFSGFTVCIDAHVETITCTEEERSKILAYLKEGVII